jgi:hypothetical protein
MPNPNPNLATRFQPGNRLGGRPTGARQRLAEKFLENLAADFAEHGETVMQTVRRDDPTAYFTTVAKLLPREVEAKLQIESKLPGNLDPQSYATLRRVVELIERYAPAGAEPGGVFEAVEAALIRAFEAPEPMAITHAPVIEMPPIVLPPPPYQSPEKYT